MRLFIAVLLSEEVAAVLSRAAEEVKRLGGRGSFVPPDNYHLTLCFLGETDREEEICRILRQTPLPPITLEPDRLDRFCRSGGDVLIARLKANKALAGYQRRLAGALREAGFALEDRPYTPHLTLARRLRFLGELPGAEWGEAGSMRIEGVSLMQTTFREGAAWLIRSAIS